MTLAPGRHRAQERLGHREIELDRGDVVDRRDRRVRRHQCAGAHLPKAEQPAERRLNQAIAQAREHRVQASLRRGIARPCNVELRHGGESAAAQIGEPSQLIFGVVQIRASFGEQRLFFLIGELDQHRAGFDVVAVFEIDAPHRVGDFRADGDRLVRLRSAERLDGVVQLIADHALGDDEGWLCLCTAAEASAEAAA